VAHGEFVSLLGPSGCGKTTTLRLAAGFMRPDTGEVLVDGNIVSSPEAVVPPERRRMSMIFQSYALWPHRSVFENVAYGLRLRGLPRGEIWRKVLAMLAVVQMEGLADRYPGELSGGQQQRVALARALVVEPEILLLDEPLSNLDANLREELRFEIRRLHQEFGITMLYVTHDQAEAVVTSDRIAVMQAGRIAQVGRPEEIFERPRTRFVAEFIGRTNVLPGVLRELGSLDLGPLVVRAPNAPEVRVGERAALCVRPARVRLRDAAMPEARGGELPGVVERAVYVGDAMEYLVRLAGSEHRLRALTPPDQRFRAGQAVLVALDPARSVLIPDEAG
ncbi:MAG: ABC transporter ATP-binding protein, partial [Deltaproteobacteria bacterium]|nr:ABC transporter ATP-binding protein [Deltaproteobacteria bacterium]